MHQRLFSLLKCSSKSVHITSLLMSKDNDLVKVFCKGSSVLALNICVTVVIIKFIILTLTEAEAQKCFPSYEKRVDMQIITNNESDSKCCHICSFHLNFNSIAIVSMDHMMLQKIVKIPIPNQYQVPIWEQSKLLIYIYVKLQSLSGS